jgi:hypothetical protein
MSSVSRTALYLVTSVEHIPIYSSADGFYLEGSPTRAFVSINVLVENFNHVLALPYVLDISRQRYLRSPVFHLLK